MSPLIWFFIVSFVVLITMIAYRTYEIRKNRLILSEEFRNRADNFILRTFSRLINFYKNQSLKLKILVQKASHKIHEKLHFIWCRISDKVDGYFMKIRGRRSIGKKGSISIYWQQVTKENGSEGEEG